MNRFAEWLLITAAMVVVTATLLSAHEPKQEAIPAALQGKWALVSTGEGGKSKNYTDRSIVFDEKEYRFIVKDLVVRRAAVSVNLSAKPTEMDQLHHFGPNKGQVMKCIFKLENDTLTIASGFYQEGRPTAFDSSKPGCSSVTVWKRQKE